jgi:hypothetical protein
MGDRPHTPRIFRFSAIPIHNRVQSRKGRTRRPFGLAPWSALELRPRIALPSAKVSNSVADDYQEPDYIARARRNDNYSAVTFSAEATRPERIVDVNHSSSDSIRNHWSDIGDVVPLRPATALRERSSQCRERDHGPNWLRMIPSSLVLPTL